jgi:hypothetical protein
MEPPSLSAWQEPSQPLSFMEEVPLLVERARGVSGPEREVLALRLNQRLDTLDAEGRERQVAEVLHELLEGGRLEGLAESLGRPCRAAAVEALLGLGFPYALEVRPEDLAYLRSQQRRGGGFPWMSAAAGGTLAGGLLGQWVNLPETLFSEEGSQGLPLIVLMGLSAMGLLAALLGPERSAFQRAGLAGLLGGALVMLYLGLFGGYYGGVSGGAALLACLLLMLPRR